MWLIKFIPYIIPLLVGSALGFYINQIRLDTLEKNYKTKVAEYESLRIVNESNLKTIETLKSELKNSKDVCSKRLKNCNQVVSRIEYIESLRDCKEKNEDISNSNHDDPVLIELNGLWSVKSGN